MKRLILLTAILCLCSFGPCGKAIKKEPAYPYTQIKSIAICPVVIQPGRDEFGNPLNLDSELLGRILAEEWTKFGHEKGLGVIFPSQTLAVITNNGIVPDNPGNLKKIGRLLKADAICLVQINHYQPFSPKSCTLTFQLYATEAKGFAGKSIININQLGWDQPEEHGLVELAQIQRRWDGQDQKVIDKAVAWAHREKRMDVSEAKSILKTESKFFRFIFNLTIREYIEDLKKVIKESKKAKTSSS